MAEAEARRHCVEAVAECADEAAKQGVFLALENHGSVVATPEGLLEIVQAVRSEWFGVNFDSGNFHGADPYSDLERIAPYAVTAQAKVEIQVAGGQKQPADLGRVAKILKAAGYRGVLSLEYEAAEPPLTAIPRFLEGLRAVL